MRFLLYATILCFTLGCIGLYIGWKRRRIYKQLAALDPTPVRQLSDPGLVELEGTIDTAAENTLTAPITQRDAVVAAWKVEQWDERGDRSTWREVGRGIESVPFSLDDGTGTVCVAPGTHRDVVSSKWMQTTGVSASDGVRINDVIAEFEQFPVETELGVKEDVLPHLDQFHEETGLGDARDSITNIADIGKKHGDRRYHEAVLQRGDEAYIVGEAVDQETEDRSHLHPDNAEIQPPTDELMVLSNQSEDSIEQEFAGSSRVLLYGGGAALVLGLVCLALLL